MLFFGVLPSLWRCTSGWASAVAMMSSSLMPAAISISARRLPLICTTRVMVSRVKDGGVEDVAGVAEFVPEGSGDVRRDGREDEQQDAQAFAAQAFFFRRDFAEGVQDFHRR